MTDSVAVMQEAVRGAYSRQKIDALLRAVRAVNLTTDPAEVLQVIVDSARELVDAGYAALGVLEPDGSLSAFIHSGMAPETVERIGPLPVGRGLLGVVTGDPRPIRLVDLAQHPASVGFPAGHPPMSSFLGVPLVGSDGTIVGNLYLTNSRHLGGFSEADEALTTALAGQASIAIQNARRLEHERLLNARLEALVSANLAVTGDLRLDAVLQRLVDVAREVGGAEYAALGVLDHTGESLSQFLHSGMDAELVERIGPLPRGAGVLGAVIETGEALRIPELSDHPASVGFPEHHPPMSEFLGVPVGQRGRIFGHLYLTNKVGAEEFDEDDQRVIEALAAQAAVAIQNAHLYEREQSVVEELRRLDRAKSDFVSNVSHELRTPLAAIIGFAQLLEGRHTLAETDLDESIAALSRQAKRLDTLVGALLDLSRIESRSVVIDPEVVDVAGAVHAALETVSIPDDVALDVDIPTDLAVWADPARVDQVLLNLVTNALRYGGECLSVRAARLDGIVVRISVVDDGPGVPSDLVPRLFQRFARGRSTAGGTGLGLAIAAGLAEAMGGRLWHNRPPGGGAAFHLELPSIAGPG